MSESGQTQKSARFTGMSVLPSTAGVVGPPRHVRKVPTTDSCTAAIVASRASGLFGNSSRKPHPRAADPRGEIDCFRISQT
jgi:hypothetical protein